MRPVLTALEMAAADEAAIAAIGLETLISRAGRAVAVTALGLSGGAYGRRVVVVAGSPGMGGAAQLCALGALRAGAGMVRLGSPGADPDRASVTEAVVRQLPDGGWADAVLEELPRCRALVVGPGLGTSPSSRAGVLEILARAELPVVLDADGLNVLGRLDELSGLLGARRAPLVLTPHDGEFARLAGAPPGADRLGAARDLARRANAVVLLKGSTTVVAAPTGEVLLAAAGSPALATAGTGDVLSGVLGAFLARGLAPLRAAGLAAHVHGLAARRGLAEGLVSGDLPKLVAEVLSSLRMLSSLRTVS